MAIGTAGTYPIKVDQGATLYFGLILKNNRKQVRPLTGATARMQVRKTASSPTALLELTTANGGLVIDAPAGMITVNATDSQTGAIADGKYVYDIEVVWPDGKVERVLMGSFTVRGEVTR